MNDRKILELAAKAAGFVDIDFLCNDGYANVYCSNGTHSAWNPLNNDDDAFQLMVKLNMVVDVMGCYVTAKTDDGKEVSCLDEDYSCKAARRAITELAAEIGKTK